MPREIGIATQMGDKFLIAFRHVEIDRGGNVAQVFHRAGDAGGRGCAVIDVERAAIIDDEADIVVAAEGVVPRQPIDDHRRRVLHEAQRFEDHLLVRAQHALGVDHAFRQSGGAGGEQEFRNRRSPDPRMRLIDGGGGAGGGKIVEAGMGAVGQLA